MRPKPTAIAAAILVAAGCSMVSGVAGADPPAPPPPEPKTTIDHDGTYAVGTDIVPGTYSSAGPIEHGTCYWKRLGGSQDNDIIDNALSKKPQVVRIEATDKAFKTDGCQPWQKTDSASVDNGRSPAEAQVPLDILNGILNQHPGGPPPAP